ncbi:MAG TPA: ATP synthase subunit I [Candidatus Acidoferrum sp.]|jgi:hypothetical protein
MAATWNANESGQTAMRTERLIGWLTLIVGAGASLAASLLGAREWAIGLLIGTALGWINFWFLRRGVDAIVASGRAQAGVEKPQAPGGAAGGLVFRYALIAGVAYVIFKYLRIPLASMVVGLCALGAAVMAASVYEIFRPIKSGS